MHSQTKQTLTNSILYVFQEDVPGAEGQRQRPGPQRHVLGAAGFRGRGQQPLEVRKRGVGPRWQTGAPEPQLRLHPPRLPQLRSALDESARVLQQSETVQQAERGRTGEETVQHAPKSVIHAFLHCFSCATLSLQDLKHKLEDIFF